LSLLIVDAINFEMLFMWEYKESSFIRFYRVITNSYRCRFMIVINQFLDFIILNMSFKR